MVLTDAQVQVLESVSSTLLGMNFDRRIPADARAVLVKLSQQVDQITEERARKADA